METMRDDNRASGQTDVYGGYTAVMDTVQVSDRGDVETVLHESTHAATSLWIRQNVRRGEGVTPLGRRMVRLYNEAKQAAGNRFNIELNTIDEFITEAFNNQEFQQFLAETPSTESTPTTISSLWTDFVNIVAEALGLANIDNTLLNDVISLAPELFKGPIAEVQARGPDVVLPKRIDKAKEKQMKDKIEKLKTPKEIAKKDKKPLIERGNFDDPSYVGPIDKMKTLIFSFDSALNSAW